MPRQRFTTEQLIHKLREAEAVVARRCRARPGALPYCRRPARRTEGPQRREKATEDFDIRVASRLRPSASSTPAAASTAANSPSSSKH